MSEKPFVLSVKALVRNIDGDCLLLRRSESSENNGGKWDLPGGKIDAGESFDQALLREVLEETGLVISLDRVIGFAQSELLDRKVAYLIMEGTVLSGKFRLSSEHSKRRWVNRRRMAKMAKRAICPQFREFAKRYAKTDWT